MLTAVHLVAANPAVKWLTGYKLAYAKGQLFREGLSSS